MDSSKRHWPSMFKTKPPASRNSHHHHQWDINPSHISSSPTNHRPSFTSSVTEERSPEPKPRWNPKPEQIRILEAIFNSGTVNPPRDEIRRIRAQLQEYGQVGDANVFYWFQNRKSRSKNKQQRNNSTTKSRTQNNLSPLSAALSVVAHSSSSSSDKSSQKSVDRKVPFVLDGLNSPTCSVNQPSFSHTTTLNEFFPEPYFFPVNQSGGSIISGGCSGGSGGGVTTMTQGFGYPNLLSSNDNQNVVVHNNNNGPAVDDQFHHGQSFGNCSSTSTTTTTTTSVLFTELMNLGAINCYKKVEENDKINNYKVVDQQQQLTSAATFPQISAQTILPPTVSSSVMSTINHIQGDGAGKSTVFINDVVVEVTSGPFNVREAFGDDVVLIHSSGLPVATNEWGVTLQSLQHGAFYYLVRLLSSPPQLQTSFQLI